MAEISAAAVMKLRKASGQGMMDCKKALEETNGDFEAAMELLRKKGLATLQKRAGRETTQGRLICRKSSDGRSMAMVTLCCETDFVAKNDDFLAACEKLGECALKADAQANPQDLMDIEVAGRKFSDILTEAVSKIGEKIEIGDFARYTIAGSGLLGSYVHFNEKTGAMVEIETDSDQTAAALRQLANEIAMHITAIKPIAVDRDSVSPSILEQERRIAAEQVKNKPANMVEKIVEGKIAKFLKENCLLEQPFVKDDSKTVSEVLNEAARAAGGRAKIKRFVRFEIG
ncbi:MAG TPA: translation elongation factor Ts [Anaerohalosphaeraceae bacterium]|nr:translation elongation factor Ts [Anaerohalosphaeraceae bacterium]HOL88950.1 translation elongation factor Ts [Anaerohalosphaeraceae bacterium]HPP56124.1 translation elongation factor Ts [Anaerohalosphaeraceae bacterium]